MVDDGPSVGEWVDTFTKDVLAQAKLNATTSEGWAGVYEAAMGFVAAVDWREPWIVALLTCELLLAACVFALRRQIDAQIGFFGVICAIVMMAQPINTMCHHNWRSFSKQDYFDDNGFFVSFVVSLPLLCIALFQMFHAVCNSGSMLITVKRHQLGIEKVGGKSKAEAAEAAEAEPQQQQQQQQAEGAVSSTVRRRSSRQRAKRKGKA